MALGIFSSLRGRVIAVMILGLGATAFAVVALTYLARSSREQRTIRARDHVEAELDRLAEIAPTLSRIQRARRGRHGLGELRSGYGDDQSPLESPLLAAVVDEAMSASAPVITQSTSAEGMPIVAGAVRLDTGLAGSGFAWAIQRVVVGPEMGSLRIAVVCLAVAMFVMVFASIQTLVAFDRGAGTLRESVVALARDLRSNVPRPKLRELAEVADGLDLLARELSRSEEDKVRLLRELSEHERWAALGRVVAGVAHEVRNPLAAIKLRTDLAETTPDLAPGLRDDLALIGSEVARLDRLVRDLLILADRKTQACARSDTDLAELVKARAALLRPWAGEQGVAIEEEGEARAPVDRDALTRAIDNLLRNAVEASPRASTVTVSLTEHEGRARVTVTDHGAGVTEENAAMVFEPFFTTKPTGTGLGLALSRAVAEAHGGTLQYARDGGLTQFTLELARG